MITDEMVEAAAEVICDGCYDGERCLIPACSHKCPVRIIARNAIEAALRAAPVPKAYAGNLTEEELAEQMKIPRNVEFIRDDGWKPIETAPRDQWVLVASDDWRFAAILSPGSGFTTAGGDQLPFNPTHWRPLPATAVAGQGG